MFKPNSFPWQSVIREAFSEAGGFGTDNGFSLDHNKGIVTGSTFDNIGTTNKTCS